MKYDKVFRNWLKSDKLRELQQELDAKRKEMININKINFKKYIKDKIMMSKEEMMSVIKNIFEFDELEVEDKEVFDWVDELSQFEASKDDVYRSLIKTVVHWSFYIVFYEIKEDYETCALIRDVINIELNDARRVMRTYYSLGIEDEERLSELAPEARKNMYSNYNEYLNKENDK